MRVIFPCWGSVQQGTLLRSVYWHDFWLVKSRSFVCRVAEPFSDTGSANHELYSSNRHKKVILQGIVFLAIQSL
jgi:hypothetical protein